MKKKTMVLIAAVSSIVFGSLIFAMFVAQSHAITEPQLFLDGQNSESSELPVTEPVVTPEPEGPERLRLSDVYSEDAFREADLQACKAETDGKPAEYASEVCDCAINSGYSDYSYEVKYLRDRFARELPYLKDMYPNADGIPVEHYNELMLALKNDAMQMRGDMISDQVSMCAEMFGPIEESLIEDALNEDEQEVTGEQETETPTG